MEAHWRAFSFVDCISSLQNGAAIRGSYAIPSSLDCFPLSLAVEAVGQLAAWGAMAAVDFQTRPVAGIAGRIHFLSDLRPGQVLELAADFDSVDVDAASYSGSASVEGVPVISLEHCVGPMLPVSGLDDPQLVQDRYALLRKQGAETSGFGGLPDLHPERQAGTAGKSLRATLAVPPEAPLFADHFPRRHVFPGSLLMQAHLELVTSWIDELPPPSQQRRWKVASVEDLKFRAFIPPGTLVELEAELSEARDESATVALKARVHSRLVGAGCARLAPDSR